MGQCDFPKLFLVKPSQFRNVGMELDFVDELILLADVAEVLVDFRAFGMEAGPLVVGGKGE